jgi:F-type H+-transporting ATPase subunit epsilon
MPHTKFPVEILTPEGELFNDEVEMVSTRTSLGLIGILANHSPLLATLDPTELRIYKSDSDIVRFAQAEGYLQVGGNRVMILVEEAHEPDQLDTGALREQLERAEREAPGGRAGSTARRGVPADRRGDVGR